MAAKGFNLLVALATEHLARVADDAWENMQRERPTLTGLNYAAGLTRACTILAENLGGDCTHWHRRQAAISEQIRATASAAKPPMELAYLATSNESAGRFAEAAELWRLAAARAISAHRADRYRAAAERCDHKAKEAPDAN